MQNYAKAKGADADELSYAEIKKVRRRHNAQLVQRQALKQKAKLKKAKEQEELWETYDEQAMLRETP